MNSRSCDCMEGPSGPLSHRCKCCTVSEIQKMILILEYSFIIEENRRDIWRLIRPTNWEASSAWKDWIGPAKMNSEILRRRSPRLRSI